MAWFKLFLSSILLISSLLLTMFFVFNISNILFSTSSMLDINNLFEGAKLYSFFLKSSAKMLERQKQIKTKNINISEGKFKILTKMFNLFLRQKKAYKQNY